MADFAPPTGPPPPKVPEGWKAVWNDQYKEWFFVNIYTKKSQWDQPTAPVYAEGDMPPGGAPPGYDPSMAKPTGPEKGGYNLSEDEKLARKLQEEENARAHPGGASGVPPTAENRGSADAYYGAGGPPGYGQPSPNPAQYGAPQAQYGQQPQYGQYEAPQQPQGMYGNPSGPSAGGQGKKGLLGGLLGKLGSKKPHSGGAMGSPYAQPGRKPGMPLGAAALGAGGGLLGGAMLASAIDGHGGHHGGGGYGYGGDDGGYGGGDDGNYGGDDGGGFGGDGGGGDFGGGDGGGDFGGGDFGGGGD